MNQKTVCCVPIQMFSSGVFLSREGQMFFTEINNYHNLKKEFTDKLIKNNTHESSKIQVKTKFALTFLSAEKKG